MPRNVALASLGGKVTTSALSRKPSADELRAGLDHERLKFKHNGVQRRLTNVEGHIIREVLA